MDNDNNVKNRQVEIPTGFTFVEVIVALAIVSISLLGLIRLHLISINMAEAAEVKSQAVLLAEEKIAETLALGYPEKGTKSGTVEKNALCMRWRTEVTDLQSPRWLQANITGLRRVCVNVGWELGAGYKPGRSPGQDQTRLRRVQMSTYVADRKLP